MPISSRPNLLSGRGMPTISPLVNPSADITDRAAGVAADGTWIGFAALGVLAEGFVVSAFCRNAQPNRKVMHKADINQSLRYIHLTHIKNEVRRHPKFNRSDGNSMVSPGHPTIMLDASGN